MGAGGQGLAEVLARNRLTVGFRASGRGGEWHIIPDLPHLPFFLSFPLEVLVKRFFIAMIIMNKPPPTHFLLSKSRLKIQTVAAAAHKTYGGIMG